METKRTFIDVLTPAERLAAWKAGAILTGSHYGLSPKKLNDVLTKSAEPVSMVTTLAMLPRILVLSAITTGIPVGVLAHWLGKRIKYSRGKELELREQIRYYTEATKELERRMAAENRNNNAEFVVNEDSHR